MSAEQLLAEPSEADSQQSSSSTQVEIIEVNMILQVVLDAVEVAASYHLPTTHQKQYDDPPSTLSPKTINLTIHPEDCSGKSKEIITGPVYLYYKLTNFYQNHRLYILSRSPKQLA